MSIIRGVDVKTFTENPKYIKFVEFGMKQFAKVEGMNSILTNEGPESLIRFLIRLAGLYSKSIKSVNAFSVKQDLYHFVGDRVEHNEVIDKAVEDWVKYVEKHFGKEEPKHIKKEKKIKESEHA